MFLQEFHRFICGYEDSIEPHQLQALSGEASLAESGEAYTMFEKITLWLAAIL